MRRRLLELLACPMCQATALELEANESDGEQIMEGSLSCTGCKERYPIERGVPRLLPARDRVPSHAQKTADRFGEEWNEFDFIGPHYEQQFLGWIEPVEPADFEGKIVLEGGCGKGRHSALASKFGAKDVIAIDLGSAVEAAFKNTKHLPNVHVVQADVFHLPVPVDSVDLAFSVGVLHHTHNPRGAFEQLVSRLRPGGRVVAWVYGAENNEWILNYVDPLRKRLTSRLPHRWVYQLSKIPAALLVAASRGVYRPLSHGPLASVGKRLFYQAYVTSIADYPFEEIHSIVHDHLIPPIANYVPRDEFKDWFEGLHLEQVQIRWHNENSWKGTAIKPKRHVVREPASPPGDSAVGAH